MLTWELLGMPRASHLLNSIVMQEMIFTLKVLWDLDGVK